MDSKKDGNRSDRDHEKQVATGVKRQHEDRHSSRNHHKDTGSPPDVKVARPLGSVRDIVSASKGKMQVKLGGALKKQPIKLTINPPKSTEEKATKVAKPSPAVHSVFNEDSDSEEDEMPMEARIRMRNVGRETPTACGPNSFGKGKLGFVDRRKVLELEIQRQQEEEAEKERNAELRKIKNAV